VSGLQFVMAAFATTPCRATFVTKSRLRERLGERCADGHVIESTGQDNTRGLSASRFQSTRERQNSIAISMDFKWPVERLQPALGITRLMFLAELR